MRVACENGCGAVGPTWPKRKGGKVLQLCWCCWRSALRVGAPQMRYRKAATEAFVAIENGASLKAAELLFGFRVACIDHGV